MLNELRVKEDSIKQSKNKIEFKFIIYIIYVLYLLFIFFSSRNFGQMFYVHLLVVVVFSLFYFGREFFYILISPVWVIIYPLQLFLLRRFLKKVTTNVPSETVVVLAHSNWLKLEAWVKPNFFQGEIKLLAKYLKIKGSNFSFYTNASIDDVSDIMSKNSVKEVYFYGHGTSHVFQLGTGEYLYYCEFNNGKYYKDFVHQMHCGTKHGNSLIDYVVPEKNRNKCFLIRKSITGPKIEAILRKKIKEFEKIN